MEKYPFKKTTVKQIKEGLNAYKVQYRKTNTKEPLYGAFILAVKQAANERLKGTLKQSK